MIYLVNIYHLLVKYGNILTTQQIFTGSKSTIETLQEDMKYVQSYNKHLALNKWLKAGVNTDKNKVNNRNTTKRYEICSKLIIQTLERHHWRLSSAFIVKFEFAVMIYHLMIWWGDIRWNYPRLEYDVKNHVHTLY